MATRKTPPRPVYVSAPFSKWKQPDVFGGPDGRICTKWVKDNFTLRMTQRTKFRLYVYMFPTPKSQQVLLKWKQEPDVDTVTCEMSTPCVRHSHVYPSLKDTILDKFLPRIVSAPPRECVRGIAVVYVELEYWEPEC